MHSDKQSSNPFSKKLISSKDRNSYRDPSEVKIQGIRNNGAAIAN